MRLGRLRDRHIRRDRQAMNTSLEPDTQVTEREISRYRQGHAEAGRATKIKDKEAEATAEGPAGAATAAAAVPPPAAVAAVAARMVLGGVGCPPEEDFRLMGLEWLDPSALSWLGRWWRLRELWRGTEAPWLHEKQRYGVGVRKLQ